MQQANTGETKSVTAQPQLSAAVIAELGANTRVTFRPVWNTEHNYLTGFIVRNVTASAEADAQGAAPVFAEDAALADIGLLVKAVSGLAQVLLQGRKLLLLVNVSYDTLCLGSYGNQYIRLLRRMSKSVRAHIVLQVTDIPANASRDTVAYLQKRLAGLSRALVISSDIRGLHMDAVLRHCVHACALNLSDKQDASGDDEALLARFVEKSAALNCAALADGVDTRAQLCAALAAGFRYIAGAAVQGDSADIGDIRRFDLETVFADLMMEMAALPE